MTNPGRSAWFCRCATIWDRSWANILGQRHGHLATIASTTQAEFTRAAEAQIAETNRKVLALVDEVSKNAPAGSEQMVAMMRSALGNANAGYEQLTKTTKQAVEALEGNLNNAVSQMTQVAEKSAGRAKK